MRQGFSLLEMALVLIIISIVAGLSMSVGTQQVKQQEVNKTYNELKIIDDALGSFVKRYGRLPCPTRNDIAATDPTFGREHATCGPTDPVPTGMVRIEYPAASGNFVRIGAVPFRALGLGADFASDEWKNRYLYAVNEHYLDDIGDTEFGSITVNDDNGNPISTEAVYVLTSFGLSGEGGIDNERIATDDACDATDRDGDNCDNDGVFVDAQFNDGNVVGSFFDDITLWRTRQRVLQYPAMDMVDLSSSTGSGTGSGSGSTTTTTSSGSGTTTSSGSGTTTSGSGTTTSGSGTTTTSGSGTTTTTSGSGAGSGSGSTSGACTCPINNCLVNISSINNDNANNRSWWIKDPSETVTIASKSYSVSDNKRTVNEVHFLNAESCYKVRFDDNSAIKGNNFTITVNSTPTLGHPNYGTTQEFCLDSSCNIQPAGFTGSSFCGSTTSTGSGSGAGSGSGEN